MTGSTEARPADAGAADALASTEAPPEPPEPLSRALLAAAATTVVVTAIAYGAPEKYAATLVGLAFLAATYVLVLRRDERVIRAFGLSLGGLLEPVRVAPRRLAKSAAVGLGWALLLMAIAFPPYALGYRLYFGLHGAFHARLPASLLDDLSGQLLVIALPEEAFFRGYLQTALEQRFPPRWRLFGVDLGPGWLLGAAIFAVGHFLTRPNPGRLAVFFPALLFGWVRARTRGIGAGVVFHASCNLFSAALARGYGLSP